jgi:membrane fusion protein, multidrug efflux system
LLCVSQLPLKRGAPPLRQITDVNQSRNPRGKESRYGHLSMSTTTTTSGRPQPSEEERDPFGRTPQAPPEKRSHFLTWLIVLVIAAGAIYFMYHQYEAAQQAKQAKQMMMQVHAIPVQTATVRKGDIGVYVSGLGTVTPVYTASITARVQGEITAIHYREGQMVRKGDPLIDIDPRPYEAQLTQVQGQLGHDEALLAQARIDLDRYQAAFNRNAVAQQQVYDQEQLVKQYEGTVKNDQGLLANAQVNLVYCHITSPIDGRVGLRLLDPGNMVQANGTSPLVVVAQLEPITVIFTVAEDYLPEIQKQLRVGHKMQVDALDRTGQTTLATGTLLTIDNEVDPTTGTFKLRAIFPNKDDMLFPNQFVNARLLVDTQRNVNLIPTAALQRNATGAFVYLIKAGDPASKEDTASIQQVTAGISDGNNAAVQGVQPGEMVAVNGFDKLQDGIKVVVHNAPRNGGGKNGSSGSASNQGTGAP